MIVGRNQFFFAVVPKEEMTASGLLTIIISAAFSKTASLNTNVALRSIVNAEMEHLRLGRLDLFGI